MKYKVERKVAVASIDGETVTFTGETGPDMVMKVKSRAARALLLAAGDLVVETTLRPASSFLIAGDNFKEKTGTLTFPVIQITDDTIRIDGKDVNEVVGLDALNDEPAPADPEYTSITVDEQWKIDRDNALAEGLLTNFESFYGSDGPNEMYKETFSSRMFYKDKPLPATPDSPSSADDSSVSPAEPATTEPAVQESDDGVPEIPATDASADQTTTDAPASEPTAAPEETAPAVVQESDDGVPEVPASTQDASQPVDTTEPAADTTAPAAPLPVFDPTTPAMATPADPAPAEATPADQTATTPAEEAQAAPSADTTVTPVGEVTTADGAGVPEVTAPAEQAVVSDTTAPAEEAAVPATTDTPVLATPVSTDATTATTAAPELATTTPAADATTQTHTPAAQ